MSDQVEFGFRVTYPGAPTITHPSTLDAARSAVARVNADSTPATAQLMQRQVSDWKPAAEPDDVLFHVYDGEGAACGSERAFTFAWRRQYVTCDACRDTLSGG